ncbi:MAG: hypothetical protein AABW73_03005 [Nanoarchaeota archaeon]
MVIKKAAETDLSEVKLLADSLLVDSPSSDQDAGFYCYSLSLDQYKRRLESPLFLVSSQPSVLGGFCLAYDRAFTNRLRGKETTLSDDPVFNFLSDLSGDFVYIDQLAVKGRDKLVGMRTVHGLVRALRSSVDGRVVIGAISHGPWKNERAIRFSAARGGRVIGEVTTLSGITLGMHAFYSS